MLFFSSYTQACFRNTRSNRSIQNRYKRFSHADRRPYSKSKLKLESNL